MKQLNTIATTISLAALALTLTLALTACGGGSGSEGTEAGTYPEIEISPASLCKKNNGSPAHVTCAYAFPQEQVLVNDSLPLAVSIQNPGERELIIRDIRLDYVLPDGAEEDQAAFLLETPQAYDDAMAGSGDFRVQTLGEGTPVMPDELTIKIVYTRPADAGVRTARLFIDSDAVNQPTLSFDLSVDRGVPTIQVNPEFIDFSVVPEGTVSVKKLTILNTGGSDLEISGLTLVGSSFFTAILHGTEYPSEEGLGNSVTFDDAIVVAPQTSTFMSVRFAPEDGSPATTKLILYSNDPDKENGTQVLIAGNQSVPCITVNPESISFGGVQEGNVAVNNLEVYNCGQQQLEIYSLAVEEGSDRFDVDPSSLDHPISVDDPLLLPASDTLYVQVTYFAEELSPLDVSGAIILDEATVVVRNNSFESAKQVHLSAAGVGDVCPTAVIKSQEGDEVIPQTVMHLFGDESHAPQGTIAKWQWEVTQPPLSQSVFVPSATFPNPTFEVNVAGIFEFNLTVFDEFGTPSCFPAAYEVVVIPDKAIHVELLWDSPGDPDETDTGPEAGTDVDLHFLHPFAAGPDVDGDGFPDGWFDIPFDAFWFNAHPNWGSFDPAFKDNPSLDRDDTDGAGPENINLDVPENVTYRVGVHYWNDHGYGMAYATVRVYLYGQLVYEVTDRPMQEWDMWAVCTIKWPEGQITAVTDSYGNPKVTPNYVNPLFYQED